MKKKDIFTDCFQEYNPRYLPDPYKYDPSRWRGVVAESEEITAFSVGMSKHELLGLCDRCAQVPAHASGASSR